MPMNLSDYHPQWPTISRQIREQAGHQCEFCDRQNGEVGCWDVYGNWCSSEEFERLATTPVHVADDYYDRFPPDHEVRWIRTVLTVAHLDHDPQNNDPANLKALCQRCHLRWDREHHAESRRRNRAERSGQQMLF